MRELCNKILERFPSTTVILMPLLCCVVVLCEQPHSLRVATKSIVSAGRVGDDYVVEEKM